MMQTSRQSKCMPCLKGFTQTCAQILYFLLNVERAYENKIREGPLARVPSNFRKEGKTQRLWTG